MGVKEKALTVASSIASGDFLRVVTSAGAARKIDYSKLAKAIVEEYNGSTIAGSAQTLKAALDSLNSKHKRYTEVALTSGACSLPITGMTSQTNVVCNITRDSNENYKGLVAYPQPANNVLYVYVRKGDGTMPPSGTLINLDVIWM